MTQVRDLQNTTLRVADAREPTQPTFTSFYNQKKPKNNRRDTFVKNNP